MVPFVLGIVLMSVWKIYFVAAIFSPIMIFSVMFRDSPASNVGSEIKKGEMIRKMFSEEWIMRGRYNSIVKIGTTDTTRTMEIIKVYGFDIKENALKKNYFENSYQRYWVLNSSWFEWSWIGSRLLTKKEKEKYGVDTLQAKILLAND